MTKKKPKEESSRVGRPSTYKPEYCDEVVELLKEGKAYAQICAHFDIDKSTLVEWQAANIEFSRAISRGTPKSESWWIELGIENLHVKEFNSRIYEMNMMNRFGWNKKSESNVKVVISQEDAIKKLA